MLDVYLADHVGDILKIFVRVHPVTGYADSLLGYCNPITGGWSLIVQHRLKPSHIEELDNLMPQLMDERIDADTGADTCSG